MTANPASATNATPLSPAQVFGRRVAEAREARGWRQAEAARRLQIDRTTFNKIERGGRGDVKLSQLFDFALRLGVSPLHLITPREDEQLIAVTPTTSLPAAVVRDWVRGAPLPTADPGAFLAQLPRAELRELVRRQMVERAGGEFPFAAADLDSLVDSQVDDLMRELAGPASAEGGDE